MSLTFSSVGRTSVRIDGRRLEALLDAVVCEILQVCEDHLWYKVVGAIF